MDATSEILNHYTRNGKRQESEDRQLRTDPQHERQRARSEYDGVRRVHDGRAEKHSYRVQVIGGARHDVAGSVALVVGVGEAFEMGEEIVAQVEFDVARDSDDDPACQELEDAFDQGNGEHSRRVEEQFVARDTRVEVVDGATQDLREEDPNSVIE